MKTQLSERSDVSCLSEFDPAPFYHDVFLFCKKVLDLIRAQFTFRKLCAH